MYKWIDKLKMAEQVSLMKNDHGCLSTSTTGANIEHVCAQCIVLIISAVFQLVVRRRYDRTSTILSSDRYLKLCGKF
jgi:hypothetical protein